MKVMVAGGTGFIGSHAVEALLAAGHEVRLLVRRRDRVDRVLRPRGIEVADIAVGDMTDAPAVTAALRGCDAALHAANAGMYGGDGLLTANREGVRNVVGIAHELELDPILYVSSITAMFPPQGAVLRADDPIGSLNTTYGRGEAEGEAYARELQAQGAPVVTIYPSGVFGPHDPVPGELTKGLSAGLRWLWPVTDATLSIVDVRDVAQIIAAALEPGRGARRFMAGGHMRSWAELGDLCERLTGRRLRRVRASPPLLRAAGRVLDLVRKVVDVGYPLTYEAAVMMSHVVPCDSRATLEELGVEFRPLEETVAEMLRWMFEAGHIEAAVAGKLAEAPA